MDLSIYLATIQTVVIVAGLGIATRQMILLGKQITFMREQFEKQLSWNSFKITQEYVDKYITELSATNLELQKQIGLLIHNKTAIKEAKFKKIMEDEHTRLRLFELVSYFESLSVGISNKLFDEETAKGTLLNVVVSSYYSLIPYINIRRQETSLPVASQFEELALRWEKDISLALSVAH